MSTYAQMAHENRNKAIADMRSILDGAADEKRDLTPEEQEQVERAEADVQRYAAEAERANRADQLAKDAAEFRGIETRVEAATKPEEQKPPTEAEYWLRGMEAVSNKGEFSYGMTLQGDVPAEIRALNVADDGEGTAFGRGFISDLWIYLREETPMFGAPVTVLRTPRGETFDWPKVTADPAAGGTVTAEAAGITELDPTLAVVTFRAHKYGITNIWSAEIDQDNVINLQSVLARTSARELAVDAGTHLTTGTGTVQPNGIVNASSAGFTATGTASGQATDNFFSPADLIDLFGAVTGPYRNRTGSGWMVSNTAATRMRKFRDANGQFMWEPSLVTGQPDRFYGRPVYENTAMAAVASASKSVLFGDFSLYYTRIVSAPRVTFSSEYKFNTDQLALRTLIRVDGNLLDDNAVKHLVSANT